MSDRREKIARTAAAYPLPKTAAVWGIVYDVTCGREEVWICRSSGDPSTGCNPWAIATPFTIPARLVFKDGTAGLRVKLEDMAGEPRVIDMPRELLQSRTRTMETLFAHGLRVARDGEDTVFAILRSASPASLVRQDE